MLAFFKKPYRYAVVFGVILALCLAWSCLAVFVIPVEISDLSEEENLGETLELARRQDTDANTQTVTSEAEETAVSGHGENGTDTPEQTEISTSTAMEPETEAPTEAPTEAETEVEYPIVTDNFYQDENIRIEITEIRRYETTVYIADVQLSSLEYLWTAFAQDKFGTNITELTSSMAERNGAIFAVNGDYYGANKTSYVIRNGRLYRKSKRSNSGYKDLVILNTGEFYLFDEKNKTAEEIKEMGAYQCFAFGPALVRNGKICADDSDEVAVHSESGNPRCAIGYIDTLHYLFLVSDGRTKKSFGLSISQLAEIMYEYGCTAAYNLDGGGSATMWFNGRIVNYPTTDGKKKQERAVSDCVCIGYGK